jgi:hypothetical protein
VPGGRLGVVRVVLGVDVVVGVLVTVTVLVLVLVDGGGTAVVTVVTVVVADVDEVVVAADAAITPQASRLLEAPVDVLPRLSAAWVITSAVPKLFLRSAAVNELVVVTSFAAPSGRTCNAVRSPLAG